MRLRRDSLLAAALFVGGWATEGAAQEARGQELVSAILAARETASKRPFGSELRALLAGKLLTMGPEALEEFWNAGGLGDIDAALREAASPKVLGDAAADLAFTPVSPMAVSRVLAVAAGSSTTLFLNGQITSGTFHSIVRGELEATFIPD